MERTREERRDNGQRERGGLRCTAGVCSRSSQWCAPSRLRTVRKHKTPASLTPPCAACPSGIAVRTAARCRPQSGVRHSTHHTRHMRLCGARIPATSAARCRGRRRVRRGGPQCPFTQYQQNTRGMNKKRPASTSYLVTPASTSTHAPRCAEPEVTVVSHDRGRTEGRLGHTRQQPAGGRADSIYTDSCCVVGD